MNYIGWEDIDHLRVDEQVYIIVDVYFQFIRKDQWRVINGICNQDTRHSGPN